MCCWACSKTKSLEQMKFEPRWWIDLHVCFAYIHSSRSIWLLHVSEVEGGTSYIHTYIPYHTQHACIHTIHAHAHAHGYIPSMSINGLTYTHIHTCMHACIHKYIHLCTSTCTACMGWWFGMPMGMHVMWRSCTCMHKSWHSMHGMMAWHACHVHRVRIPNGLIDIHTPTPIHVMLTEWRILNGLICTYIHIYTYKLIHLCTKCLYSMHGDDGGLACGSMVCMWYECMDHMHTSVHTPMKKRIWKQNLFFFILWFVCLVCLVLLLLLLL
jgi:hypothetical protein